MKLRIALVVIAVLALGGLVQAEGGKNSLKASLDGYQEVPAISSSGSGALRLRVVDDATIEYELSYENLEGTATASHVHLGQKSVNGGVMFFLCGGGGRPACPPTSGSVSGSVTAVDILGPAGQGIAAMEFAEALAAIRAGVTYANVHSTKHPGGEIRGQVRGEGGGN
jgi:hypothetical protein